MKRFEQISVKDNQLICNCLNCHKNYGKKKDLIKRFTNTYQFCDRGIHNLFCYYEKTFIHTGMWISGKNFTKHYYLVKKILTKFKHVK